MQKSLISRFVPSDYFAHVQLTGDANTYPTGGFPFSLADFQLTESFDDILAFERSGLFTIDVDSVNFLVKVLQDPGTGLAEVSNGGSTTGLIVDIYVFGR